MKRTRGSCRFVASLTLLSAVCFAGCQQDGKSEPAGSTSRVPIVTVANAERDKVVDYVDMVGRTAAYELVEIRSRVSGFLQKKHFEDGQRVKAGDLLFTIEPDQYDAIHNQSQARILVAKAEVDLAEKTFQRSKKLMESNAVSRQEYEENQAKVETARAQLVAAEADAARTALDVEYTKIKSPIDGRVDRHLIDEGNYVTGGALGGTVLTTVVNDSPIKAIADVDESTHLEFERRQREMAGDDFVEADKVSELDIPCYLQLSDEKGYPHEGRIEYGSIRIDEGTGTSQIRAVFDNADGLLVAGMFVRLRVPLADAYDAVLVPDRAVGTDQATRFVYVVGESKVVEQRRVELGAKKGDQRVIKAGVRPGESVVVAGLQLVQPGMTVETELLVREDRSGAGSVDQERGESNEEVKEPAGSQ